MSGKYTRYDFSESIGVTGFDASTIKKVLKAWGHSPGGEWEGGFLLELVDGTYAYIGGWCDYTGWG